MRLDDPRDRHRVARRLEHHPIRRREALREHLKLGRRRPDATRRSRAAALGDRDLTEVAMHV
jgi:hypothetical protein